MAAGVEKVELRDIQALRALFSQELNALIRYYAWHEAGWTDSYHLTIDGAPVGYGSVKGRQREDRDTVFEFFIVPPFRRMSRQLFLELIDVSGAAYVECQSNDPGLSAMLYEFASGISADVILFADHTVTHHTMIDTTLRRKRDQDRIFEHTSQPVGDFVIEVAEEIVATGGFLTHYNAPFADLYMEVREDSRRRGLASFLLQEAKKECYLAGRVPAARCDVPNTASAAALRKAGLRECGFMLKGEFGRRRS
jgi:GNAT superfamily N-acetyltransferase